VSEDDEFLSMETPTNLGYLGLIPFFLGAVGPWVFYDRLEWLTSALMWYSLAALAFLSGSIWGIVLHRPVSARRLHFAVASSFMLLGWIAIFFSPLYALGMLMFLHVALYYWERYTHLKHALGPDYLLLRQQLTWPAVACHMLALFNLIRAMK
jgi:hypothetical protein